MTAKVTLSFSDDTIADARHYAQREGMSLSAWIDQAAREKALRELFSAHARAVRHAGYDETAALDEQREIEMVDVEIFGHPRTTTGGDTAGPAVPGDGSGTAGTGAAQR